jgi:hypothetical protein
MDMVCAERGERSGSKYYLMRWRRSVSALRFEEQGASVYRSGRSMRGRVLYGYAEYGRRTGGETRSLRESVEEHAMVCCGCWFGITTPYVRGGGGRRLIVKFREPLPSEAEARDAMRFGQLAGSVGKVELCGAERWTAGKWVIDRQEEMISECAAAKGLESGQRFDSKACLKVEVDTKNEWDE